MKSFVAKTLPLLTLLTTTYAQTFTSCNPLNRTDCPLDTALGVGNYSINFVNNMMSDRVWNTTAGTVTYGDGGAQFVVKQRGDAPTVQSNFYLFFGQVEVIMKASVGQGIVSSIVLESDDLDEVDWEWIGGNNSYVETNYFGKGNTTSFDRAVWYPVDNPQDTFHNYTVDWSAEKLDWYVDGQIVRTLPYSAANGGHNFPQTPCNVRLGIWAGGDPKNSNGTIEWAGGVVDYDKGPYTMTVQSVRVSDASRGTQYQYGDTSGTFESIKMLNNTKALKLDGDNSQSTTQSVQQKWHGLSQQTKIIIIASICGVLAVSIGVFGFCCIKQRRLGKHERLIEDAKFEKNASELMAYRADMTRQRSENNLHYPQQQQMGNAGAMYSQNQPMLAARSPNPAYSPNPNAGYNANTGYANHNIGYANSNYAQSVSTFGSGSGRGYQRY